MFYAEYYTPSVKVSFQYKNRGILAKLMLNHIDNKI